MRSKNYETLCIYFNQFNSVILFFHMHIRFFNWNKLKYQFRFVKAIDSSAYLSFFKHVEWENQKSYEPRGVLRRILFRFLRSKKQVENSWSERMISRRDANKWLQLEFPRLGQVRRRISLLTRDCLLFQVLLYVRG